MIFPRSSSLRNPSSPGIIPGCWSVDRVTGELGGYRFYRCCLGSLRPGDCLILNDSRVLPARLYGQRKDTGGAVELLLLQPPGK